MNLKLSPVDVKHIWKRSRWKTQFSDPTLQIQLNGKIKNENEKNKGWIKLDIEWTRKTANYKITTHANSFQEWMKMLFWMSKKC